MAEEQPATRKTKIHNTARGARYVNTVDGPVTVQRGTTSAELEIRESELADLPEGLGEGDLPKDWDRADAIGVRTIDTGGAAEGVDGSEKVDGAPGEGGGGGTIPDDLQSDRSADGIVGRDKLLEVAKAEGVEVESDDNKEQLVAKIVAKRGSA
jgi:hypothetical protein